MVDKKKIEFQKQLWRLGDPYRNEPLGKEVFDEVGYRAVSYTKNLQQKLVASLGSIAGRMPLVVRRALVRGCDTSNFNHFQSIPALKGTV